MRYEITDNRMTFRDRELMQICATMDLPEFGIKAGDLGGWVERAESFPQDSTGWIFPNAKVMHGGKMHGGEMWGGEMRGGEMHGGKMHGGKMTKDILHMQGLRWPITVNDTHMTIGCQTHEILKWEKFSDKLIAKMDSRALEFWTAHKSAIFAMIAATGRLGVSEQ